MAENPIKYSEFIKADDSIANLIKQLEQALVTYDALLKKVREDAVKTEDSIKKTTKAAKEREETVIKATEDTEKLIKAKEQLQKSRSETAKQLQELKLKQKDQNTLQRLQIKLNSAEKGSYNALSAQYSINKIRLNAMSKAQRSATKDGQKLEKETKAIYEEMKRLQENTGKFTLDVGNYGKALEGLPGPLGAASTGVAGFGAQLKKLLLNPVIGILALLVGAFAAVTASMKRSEEGQDRLNKVMIAAGSVFDNVMDVLTEFGIALFDSVAPSIDHLGNQFGIVSNFFQLQVLKMRKAWAEFTGDAEKAQELGEEITNIAKQTAELLKSQQELEKQIGDTFDVAIEKSKALGDEIENDIILANKLADTEAAFNRQERAAIVENAKLRKDSAEARAKAKKLELLDAEKGIEFAEKAFVLDEQLLKNELALAKTQASIAAQRSALASDDIDAKRQIAEATAKVTDLEARFAETQRQRTEQLNTLRNAAFTQERERAAARIEIARLEEAEIIRANSAIINNIQAGYDEREAAALDNARREVALLKDQTQIRFDELDKRKELQLISEENFAIERRKIETKLTDDILKVSENLTAQREKITTDEIKNLENASKERFLAATSFIEDTHKLRISEIDLMKATEAEKTKLVLEAEKQRLRALLDLNRREGGKLSTLQIETIENQIKKIEQKIAGASEKNLDLYSLIGLKLSDEGKSAISQSTQFALESINTVLDARIVAAQQGADLAQAEIDRAQARLDAEIEARNNGFAFNITDAQRQLELAKRTQERALKEQERAQKQKQKIQTLEQVSSLITAAANIWGQLGFPWAIPAIAVMFGSYAISKVKAKQASQQFGEGGLEFLEGGSHHSGNDINIGTTNDGRHRTAEGGEALAVFNKRRTRQYRKILPDLVKSLNKGTFEDKYLGAYSLGGITLQLANGAGGSNLGSLEKDVSAIRKQGEKQTGFDAYGNRIVTYKNLTTVYVSN